MKPLDNRGFSMVEMLFSFSIFCIIASFFPILFQITSNESIIDARLQNMEWELFISQLKKEVQRSDGVSVVNGKLTLVNGGEKITFQKYHSVLRRQVNGTGHEVVLQNVESVHFYEEAHSIYIKVEDSYHQSNSATIFSFIAM